MIEILLVMTVITAMMTLGMKKMAEDSARSMAVAQGKQLEQVGKAANAFVSMKYPEITGLSGSPSWCSGSGLSRTCTLTTAQLVAEGLLPTNFQDSTLFRRDQGWAINLRLTGSAPSWGVEGAVVSKAAWTKNGQTGGIPEMALAGIAAEAAGPDAGVVSNTSGSFALEGLGGTYAMGVTALPSVSAKGQIGFHVGTTANAMNAFLRRDGTLPMTGNLAMGGNDVSGGRNASFTGNVAAGGNLSVTGDAQADGGLRVLRNAVIGGTFSASGGRFSVDSAGNAAASKDLSVGGALRSNGIVNNGDFSNTGSFTIGGSFNAGASGGNTLGSTNVNGDLDINGNLRVRGTTQLDGQATTNGIDNAGNIASGTLQPTTVVVANTACPTLGQMASGADGSPLFCVGGVWKKPSGDSLTYCGPYDGSCKPELTGAIRGFCLINTTWGSGYPRPNETYYSAGLNRPNSGSVFGAVWTDPTYLIDSYGPAPCNAGVLLF